MTPLFVEQLRRSGEDAVAIRLTVTVPAETTWQAEVATFDERCSAMGCFVDTLKKRQN
jgi:hypothetical protein